MEVKTVSCTTCGGEGTVGGWFSILPAVCCGTCNGTGEVSTMRGGSVPDQYGNGHRDPSVNIRLLTDEDQLAHYPGDDTPSFIGDTLRAGETVRAENVHVGPFETRLDSSADRELYLAVGQLDKVVIVGYTKDGAEYFGSSVADGPKALWMLQRGIKGLLGQVDKDETK